MKECIITAFEPFGGQKQNASLETIKEIPDQIGIWHMTKVVCPVIFKEAFDVVLKATLDVQPDLIIMLGEAGGRKRVMIERVGINIQDANIPDQMDVQPKHLPILPQGPDAYFTRLPYPYIIKKLQAEGYDIDISNSAGTYVCNDLMYRMLHEINQKNLQIQAGFIHVPYGPMQVKDATTPHKSYQDNARVIKRLIEILTP